MAQTQFNPTISDEAVEDFRERLSKTRFPDPELVDDWSQGLPIQTAMSLCEDLQSHDFRSCLDRMVNIGSYRIEIDGVQIHYLHRKGPTGAPPLILTHGWPGGIIEFLDVIEPLSQHFHLILPSLPGFGFSTAPRNVGWGLEKIADSWAKLMQMLGYDQYVAQGGDWGSEVSALLAHRHPDHCKGAHINMVSARLPKDVLQDPTPAEQSQLKRLKDWGRMEMAYFRQQASRPQTLGYALADSPMGQASWIAEKFHAWTDHDTDRPFGGVSYTRLLDMICLYWFTNSATSSARLYWESAYNSGRTKIEAPLACTLYPAEINAPSRRWAEDRFLNIKRWTVMDHGGHFPAMEVPDLFIDDVIRSVQQIWEQSS